MSDNAEQIVTNALAPRRAGGDGTSMEQHSIPDQLAADRARASKSALRARALGFRQVKLRPGNNADTERSCD